VYSRKVETSVPQFNSLVGPFERVCITVQCNRLALSNIPRDYIPFNFNLQIKTDPIFEATRYVDTPDGKC
jgi:hypothetical protein